MQTAFDALRPEIERLLLVRDLATASRNALQLEPAADAVSLSVNAGPHGVTLDVTYSKRGVPISGWGQ